MSAFMVFTWNSEDVRWGPFATLDQALDSALRGGQSGRRYVEVDGRIVFDVDAVCHAAHQNTAFAHITYQGEEKT